jgi:hypothetical protein
MKLHKTFCNKLKCQKYMTYYKNEFSYLYIILHLHKKYIIKYIKQLHFYSNMSMQIFYHNIYKDMYFF